MANISFNPHQLDAAYRPFPSFAEWIAKVSVDTTRWDRYNATVIDRGKHSPDILARARNIATRAAAIDTGAIEGLYEVDRGFTFTVAFQSAAWEAALDKKGEQVRSLFEAQLHAYDFVLDLATKAEQFSEAAIRQLHVEICKAQDTYRVVTEVGFQEQSLPKGRYKVLPNHVHTPDGTIHSYAPVDVTPVEMARLLRELRSDEFSSAHPVIQAAYAHYGLVVIHPFADGNGRVARALASAFTYRAISMPIVILSEQKESYLDSLALADKGDYQAFVNFMMARSVETIQMVSESLYADTGRTVESSLARFESLYQTVGGYTQDEVDAAAVSLEDELLREFDKLFRMHRTSKLTLGIHTLVGGSPPPVESGYRHLAGEARVKILNLISAPPATADISQQFYVVVPIDASGVDDVKVIFADRNDSFAAQIADLIPRVSGVVKIRAGVFANRVLTGLLDELTDLAQQSLRGHGHN